MDIKVYYSNHQCRVQWNGGTANHTPKAHISKWPKVQDQVRGYYLCSSTGWSIDSPQCNVSKRAALIVESPHKYEFDDKFNPLAPLNGASGKRFCGHIIKHLNAWLPPQNHIGTCLEIKIFNPIQHQASLYHFINGRIPYDLPNVSAKYTRIDRQMRDTVWKFLYCTCNLKGDFIRRLSAYNPDYIFNCCTGGKSQTKTNGNLTLKEIVQNDIFADKFFANNFTKWNNYFVGSHPYSWY